MDQAVIEEIKRDLATFADPGTPTSIDQVAEHAQTVTWQQGGHLRRARFRLGDTSDLLSVRVRMEGSAADLTYPAFLASDRMANVRAMARNSLTTIAHTRGYVPQRISGGNGQEDALTAVRRMVSEPSVGTNFVFISGDAGSGKSSLLTELTRRAADRYLDNAESTVWLYVNAQGSSLARLDQALAEAIDRVRAPFPFSAANPLVRTGVLILAVDGFDELIGSTGSYDEAFSSLTSFIAGLDGRGTVVASARSAYYEEEFLARSNRTIGFTTDKWNLRLVQLEPWSADERALFLEQYFTGVPNSVELSGQVERVFSDQSFERLAGLPLFVSRVASLVEDGDPLATGDADLLVRLINAYLSREANTKLLGTGQRPLLSHEQLADLYSELANEMWRQETRELTRSSLRALVDVWGQVADVNEYDRAVIAERFPYAAMLQPGLVDGAVAFEHELYFSYFLTTPIVDALRAGSASTVGLALRKGRLPSQAGLLVGRVLEGEELTAQTLELLSAATARVSIGQQAVRENAGIVVAGLAKRAALHSLRIVDIDFVDVDLAGTVFERCTFVRCAFRGTDLRNVRFTQCLAEGVLMDSVLLDAASALDIQGLDMRDMIGPIAFDEDQGRRLYDPVDLVQFLQAVGLPAAGATSSQRRISQAISDLVESVARLYERTNIAAFGEDDQSVRRISGDPAWPIVRSAMIDAEVAREEARQSTGRRQLFLRMLVRPSDLMAGQLPEYRKDPRVVRFWTLLEAASTGT